MSRAGAIRRWWSVGSLRPGCSRKTSSARSMAIGIYGHWRRSWAASPRFSNLRRRLRKMKCPPQTDLQLRLGHPRKKSGLQLHAITQHDDAVQCEPWLRAIPVDEFVHCIADTNDVTAG